MAKKAEVDSYSDLANFYKKKLKEPGGGKFFTIFHRKAPAENGVWARSKHELERYLNRVRRHFTHIQEETTA